MKRFLALCFILPGLGAPLGYGHAASAAGPHGGRASQGATQNGPGQTVVDGSGQAAASPFGRATLKSLVAHFGGTATFRQLSTHTNADKKQVLCGQISLDPTARPADDSFMPFGAQEDGDEPVVFQAHALPASIDPGQANQWINHGADLEALEELGCVPEGSYRQYSDKLNDLLQHHRRSIAR
ncbi:hypothetical protein K2X14_07940 [Acetobacter sp. TBRC 12305]|uniref:Secreted protein n=1 Tax=Acetobacter garciniae TaxID=2817435 RepID=A0A939HIX2_9PROT|nr:hypothetical protein [Acetobacter garciniae]MBO1325265.1 hypothetical protein [Acetobacter garciniae]MBX0344763.1 hypothetical protein [Acetobacter garciniae]